MIKITRTDDPRELIKALKNGGYEAAAMKGITASALLEEMSPTKDDNSPKAFERCLKECGIVLKDKPEHGIYASKGALFFQSDVPDSSALFPEFINRTIRAAEMEQTDLLKYLVSAWESGNTTTFQAFYFDDTATNRQAGRRAEGAPARIFKFTGSDKTVKTKDFSIELDMSYEAVLFTALPVITLALKRVALQRQLDEAAEAIYILVNGGSSTELKEYAAATEVTLDNVGIESGTITLPAYLKFLAGFGLYSPNVIVGGANDVIDVYLQAMPTAVPALVYNLLDKGALGGTPSMPNLPFNNMTYLKYDDTSVLASKKLVTLDSRYALQGHRSLGLDLVETQNVIDSKFKQIVIGNRVGFSKIFTAASKVLNITAIS